MFKVMSKNGAILAIFAIISTAIVAMTYWATKDTIAQQKQWDLQKTLNLVIPSSMHDNELSHACIPLPVPQTLPNLTFEQAYLATLQGQANAIAIKANASDGYNGLIQLIIGLDMNGVVTGTRVLSHNETPGLGDKIDDRKSDWILNFDKKTVTKTNQQDWAVQKDGGEFDQFTGATITPRAVVNAVKNTVLYFQDNKTRILELAQSSSSHCES